MAHLNVKQSLSVSSSIRRPITQAVQGKSRAHNAPSIPSQPLTVNTVSRGFNTHSVTGMGTISATIHCVSPPTFLSTNSVPVSSLGSRVPANSTLSLPVTQPSDPQTVQQVAKTLARKRVAEELVNSWPQKKQRKQRIGLHAVP